MPLSGFAGLLRFKGGVRVYRLFELSAAEITQIKTALANTRSQSSEDDESEN